MIKRGDGRIAALLRTHGAKDTPNIIPSFAEIEDAVDANDVVKTNILLARLANGAILNQQNRNGWTLLPSAATQNHKDVAAMLLAHGADVNARNEDGETPGAYPWFYPHAILKSQDVISGAFR